MGDLARWNKGFKYVFTIIDGFSKFLRATPIKSKHATETAKALREMIEKNSLRTNLLYTDAGKEFMGQAFQSVLKQYNIKHRICTANEFHCPFIERANRSVKEKLFQAMTASFTREWLTLLPKIVSTYNQSIHSVTKVRPSKAAQSGNRNLEIFKNIRARYNPERKQQRPKFSQGDYVRIYKSSEGNISKKGYLPRFTWEIFKISKRVGNNNPPAYQLEDLAGEKIVHAVFYEPELSRVHPSVLHRDFPVREIISQKGNQVKVWWQGTPRSKAEWINKKNLTKRT
ncbi:MAG: transposase family protein [Flavobacteriaceae bacterium]|nr:transposase family protein [Flavobacteriaceae bacterium]